VRVDPHAALRAGGYRLRAGAGGVEIEARDAAGRRHAQRTLDQIVYLHAARGIPAEALAIPAFEIEDWPDFSRRGVLLDISRSRVPTMETLFGRIDWLAAMKIDELQLYTEHTFAYRGHEEVWSDASPITPDEARMLDAFCRDRGIDLVPNQQSLGHMHRWLAHERYRHLSEAPEGVDHAFSLTREPFSLCPTDPKSLALLADLYGQLLPNFASPFFNVGLDETFDIGMGRSRAACETRGKGRVYLDFLLGVHRLAGEHGRRIQFWGDVVLQHPELLGDLPRDAIALAWGYEADHPFAEQARAFAESGLEFYVCPGTSSWQSVAGRTRNATQNLAAAAVCGREAGAAGYLVADWGDRGHLQPLFASFAGLLLGAGFAWNASAAGRMSFDLPALLDAHVFRDRAGVLGRAAVDLGNAYLETWCPSTNGSALFFLLAFADKPLPHERMPGLSIEGLARARDFIDERRSLLDGARSDRSDAQLVVCEMRWAADLLAFACRFGIARLHTPPGAPIGAIPDRERRELAAELAPLVSEHRRCWSLRNRPGGLDESAGWLERVLTQLEQKLGPLPGDPYLPRKPAR
jgi:hexosaminidase